MMVQLPTPPAPPVPPSLPDHFVVASGTPLDSPALVMIILAALAAATLVLWPLVRALARRLEGRGAPSAALQAEVDELRARLHELEGNQSRLLDLEERLDFTERILTQKEPARLPDAR
jgi:flagellar biosynthesis/type III secretory pathway M-ring protein FliF/YscJ